MHEKKINKKLLKWIAVIIFIIVLIILTISIFGFSNNLTENKTVTIEEGATTPQIAEILKEENVISSKMMFLLKVRLSDYNGQLKYGEFEFSPDDSYDDVI